jgi:hypothetical protein
MALLQAESRKIAPFFDISKIFHKVMMEEGTDAAAGGFCKW